MTRMTASPRRKLDGPWTKELDSRPPRYELQGAVRYVIALPAALIVLAALILLVYFLVELRTDLPSVEGHSRTLAQASLVGLLAFYGEKMPVFFRAAPA